MPDYLGKPIGSFLGSVLGGFAEGQEEQGLKNLYNTSINKLTEFFNPPATYTDQTGQIPRSQVTQNMVNDVPTQQSFEPDMKGALQSLYETTPEFLQYGDEGIKYANLLQNFYKANEPEYEYKKIGNDEYIFNKNNPKQYQVIKGEEDLKPYTGEIVKVKKNEDGTYTKTVPLINNKGDITYKTMPADETDYEIFNATVKNKSLDYEEKLGLSNQYKIQYKLDLGNLGLGGKTGRSYSGKVNLNEVKEDQLADMLRYDKLNRDFKYLTDTQKEERYKLETKLQDQLKLNGQELTDLTEDIRNAGEKEQKNIMAGIDTNIVKELKKNMEIGNKIQAKYDALKKDLVEGRLTEDEFIQTLRNWFEANKANLPQSILEQIQAQLPVLK